MERWIEIYKGKIPCGKYVAEIIAGEEKGTIIHLENKENKIEIDFGALYAIRILDEGVVLLELFNENEFDRYQKGGFDNTIYKLEQGEFGNFVKKINGNISYDAMQYEHYLVVTLNYYIEIISPWKPEIRVIT